MHIDGSMVLKGLYSKVHSGLLLHVPERNTPKNWVGRISAYGPFEICRPRPLKSGLAGITDQIYSN